MASERERHLEFELESLRSHNKHIQQIYAVRWGGLALSALTITAGAIMTFHGLEGSFNWAVEVPHSITAKLTNASPGIGFAMIGLILGFMVIRQKPVGYTTSRDEMSITGDYSPERSPRYLLAALAMVAVIALAALFAVLLFIRR
jgi:protein-S-isoprenylcysteine O-methyltransferase Ste14